jgi:hypothetical protein
VGEKEESRKGKEIKSIIRTNVDQNAKHGGSIIHDAKNDVDAIFYSVVRSIIRILNKNNNI